MWNEYVWCIKLTQVLEPGHIFSMFCLQQQAFFCSWLWGSAATNEVAKFTPHRIIPSVQLVVSCGHLISWQQTKTTISFTSPTKQPPNGTAMQAPPIWTHMNIQKWKDSTRLYQSSKAIYYLSLHPTWFGYWIGMQEKICLSLPRCR